MKPEDRPQYTEKEAEILKTASEVFAREGFRNTDVQVIADLAGVGKGTVYRHFGNKEQLFLATAKFSLIQAGKFIEREILAGETPEALRAKLGVLELLKRIAVAYARYYQTNPLAIELIIQERAEFRETVFPTHLMHRAEGRGPLDELFEAGVAQRELRNIDPRRATDAFADLLYGSVVNGCLGGGKSQLVERVESAMEVFLYGLAPTNTSPSK